MSSLSDYQGFNNREKQEIEKIIGIILNQTCILSRKYDISKEKLVINADYKIAINYLSFLKDYFEIMGAKLIDDDTNGVLYTSSSNFKVYNLTKMECIYLLLIKLIYEEKQEAVSLDKTVVISLDEIHYKIEVLKLLPKLPSTTQRIQALKTLKRFQLIERIGGSYDVDGVFIVYPSIVTVLNNQDIAKILERLKVNDINEDSEITEEDYNE